MALPPLQFDDEPAQQELPPLQFDSPAKRPLDDFMPTSVPTGNQNAINNITGGLRAGFEETFAGSMGTILEAKLPLGRLFAEDQNGQFKVWQSTPDYLGIDEDTWENMDYDSRRQRLADETEKRLKSQGVDTEGTDYMLSKIVGYFLDPTIAVPVLGQTMKARAATGAAIGATDVSTWEYAQEGKVSPSTVAMGAAVGGILPPTLEAIGKPLTRALKNKHATNIIDDVEFNMAQERIAGNDPITALNNVKQKLNLTDKDIVWATNRAQRKPRVTNVEKSKEILSEHRMAKRSKKGEFGQGRDKIIEPISNRIKKISEPIWKNARLNEMRFLESSSKAIHLADDFVRDLSKLKKADAVSYERLSKALANRDRKTIEEIIRNSRIKNMDRHYKDVQRVLDDVYREFKGVGRDIKQLENYFPRWISDLEGFKAQLGKEAGNEIEEIFKYEAKKIAKSGNPRPLTEKEKSDILHKYMQGTYDIIREKAGTKVVPRAAKERKIKELSDEQLPFYAEPAQALHSYIRQSYEDIMRRRFLGKADTLEDSVANLVERELKAGNLDIKDVPELKNLLTLRYSSGNQPPAKLVQDFKNYTYSFLLGNPISAVTQLGDLALASYRNGMRNTISGVAKTLTGKGLTPKEMGLLDDMFEEFASTRPSKRFLEASFKYGGFKATDALGKGAIINGALRKNYKLAKSQKGINKLRQRWGAAFGSEMDDVIADLKAGKMTERVKLLAFSELSDLQPISRLEMPEKYLQYPNMRVLYMLKTFTLKHINLMREDIGRQFRLGNRTLAIKNAAKLFTLFTAANMGTDVIKNIMQGKETEMDDLVVDNLLKNTGIVNRYNLGDVFGYSPTEAIIESTVMPPTNVFDPPIRTAINVGRGVVEGDLDIENIGLEDNVKYIPVFGKLFYMWGLGGIEEWEDRQN